MSLKETYAAAELATAEKKEKHLSLPGQNGKTLDPGNWDSFREQAHRMLDDVLDYTRTIRERPVWQPIPPDVRPRFCTSIPLKPTPLPEVHQEFVNYILPFAVGNAHPGFMGWVHGGGTPVGMLAEMLAAALNANTGGRDQIPVEVEHEVVGWMRDIFGFPETASGLVVTGTSMANVIAVVIARDVALGYDVRAAGVAAKAKRLTAYASNAIHSCIGKAMDLCGLGSDALRLVRTDGRGRIDLHALEDAITKDRAAGLHPFLIVGTAGTVNIGAIDGLADLADIARRETLWFHIDGAFGALGILAPDIAPKLRGIERADSLAFDFHKWGQVPYDCGFVLVRDGNLHRNAFAQSSEYLRRETRGLAAGSPWPSDYGPELSRGFRALKVWFTLKVYGAEAIGSVISRTCALARYLAQQITNAPELELLAPVELNVVCFRYRAPDSDRVNARIAIELQESGRVAPSTTIIDGRLAIRAAIVNHRTAPRDIDELVRCALESGHRAARPQGDLLHGAPQMHGSNPPREGWQAELEGVERQLSSEETSCGLHFRRAFLLAELGRLAEAKDGYINVLRSDPRHLAALNNLGSVLIAMGHREAAGTAYNQAVLLHPDDPVSRVNWGNFLLEESERLEARQRDSESLERKREARKQYEQALRVKPDSEKAHEGLSYLLEALGEPQLALLHRREAFRNRHIISLPFRGARAPVSILHLAATTGGNVRLQRFLDDRIFKVSVVLPEFYNLATPIPDHQLVLNGIGDAELSSAALADAQSFLSLTSAPVINPPAAVLATGRSNNAKRFASITGVVPPVVATLSREQLSGGEAAKMLAAQGLEFPLLLRAFGFHTGRYFTRVETPAALPEALAKLPGENRMVMRFLDARASDGKIRKYRVMMIDGQLYPLHLAISNHWKIHYFTSEMADSADYRAEEAAFLNDMPQVLGPLAMNALRQIQSVLGLDYAGIDFGLSAKGEIVFFEANATMVVDPPAPDERWNYRRPANNRIYLAVQKMLLDRVQSNCHAMPPFSS